MQFFLAVLAGVVVAGVCALCLRFDIRPKVEMKYEPGNIWNPKTPPGKMRGQWEGLITLYNPTPHTAYDIQFSVPPCLPTPALDARHLAAGEKKSVEFNVVKEFDRSDVYPHEHEPPRPDFNPPYVDFHRDFYPPELRAFTIEAMYSNGHWLRMYSRLRRDGEQQECTHHRIRPKTGSRTSP